MAQQFVRLDRVGFPIIWIPPINAYIHWLPFTKIQLEYFLSETTDSTFNESWYRGQLLDKNERVSPGNVRQDNYWGTFLTGLLPTEARRIGTWNDGELLLGEEWIAAYRFLKKATPQTHPYLRDILNAPLRPRTRLLLQNLDSVLGLLPRYGPVTVADQSFMRQGVMEYVYEDNRRNTFAGFGQTNANFFSTMYTPDNGHPERLSDPINGARLFYYGFRLKVRG